jgi:hypothetical protein
MPSWGHPRRMKSPPVVRGAGCRDGVEVGCRMVPLSPRKIFCGRLRRLLACSASHLAEDSRSGDGTIGRLDTVLRQCSAQTPERDEAGLVGAAEPGVPDDLPQMAIRVAEVA